MDLVYLFRIFLKRKWIIIFAVLLSMLVAYYLTKNNLKYYRSIAQIATGFTVSDDIKVNDENFSFYEADTKFNNVIVTFTSPTVISQLSYLLILHDLNVGNTSQYSFKTLTPEQKKSTIYKGINQQTAKSILENKLETMTMLSTFKPDEKKILDLLKLYNYDYQSLLQRLYIYRLQRTDYIQIEYTSENPELSAYVVNNTFKQFLRYYKNIRSDKSQESIDTLRSLMDKKKQELDEKNLQLRGQGGLDAGQENTSKLDLIISLETTLTEEKNKQTTLIFSQQKIEQKLASLESSPTSDNTASTNVTNNDEMIILRKAMNEAYSAYINTGSTDQALLKKYNTLKSEYESKVASLKTAVKPKADAKSVTEIKNDLLEKKADIELDIKASDANIQSIQQKINSTKGTLVHDGSKSAIVESLLKDAQLANKEYLDAKQKYNDAFDISNSSVNNFRQILVGQPATEPEPSKRLLIIGMAGMAVLIISILLIFLLAYLDSSVKTPAIFAKVVNLKMLSMVNVMNLKHTNLADLVSSKSEDDTHDKKRLNVFRESIRKLRYEIENSGKKIFLFTSTQKGEGKTTLIQALSYSMSLSKKRILIIDTNFCNNDLTMQLMANPILEKINTEGNAKNIIQQVKDAAVDIGVGTVYIVGSEGGDYTPSEILPAGNILLHLKELTTEYDFIFLEGPPLNDFSDSRELSRYVDGVIAIFSATHILKQIDKESLTFFSELNGKFCGAVLNKVDLENVNTA